MLRFGTITLLAIAALLDLLWIDYFFGISLWAYLLVPILWALLTIIGSFHIRWNYHIRSLHSNKSTNKNIVAITFDDGPHPVFTRKVLQLLAKYDAKASFFCIGKNVEAHPELLQEIIEQGHVIGNHTYSHMNNFGFLGTDQVIEELQKTNATVNKITGKEMNLYRPAFGVTNPNIKRALKKTGLQSIGWNIRSLDTTQLREETVLKRITNKISKGDVILLHDTNAKSVAVLEQLLLFMQNKKLQSVSVDRLLNVEPYA